MKEQFKNNSKFSLVVALLLTVSVTAFYACKKSGEKVEKITASIKNTAPAFSSLSPQQQVNVLSRDEDWKTIVELNTMFMDKVVNSKESFNSVTLNDEEKILSIIGMSREEYLGKVAKAKSAAERILTKYNISKNLNASCASCNLQKNEKDFADFKQSINFFKSNRSTYEQQRQNIITTSLVAAEPGGGGESLCCGPDFYLCATICAATIEAFPVYLACCYLCYRSYCCKS
ncbi:hypothetical protein ACHMWN_05825 [Pedobacter sp. UC225_61]|uniref:hypothetical protein n=1 Tax=Pedobacter sp. UC225_61 TaxID=3374623 RepID=UPI0037B2ECA3